MGTIRISEGDLSAAIEPAVGAGLSRLTLRRGEGPCEILRPAEGVGRFADLSMYLMAPWTNRIAGAAFEFGGRRHQLRPDWEDGTAIHGDVKTREWRILDRTPVSARLGLDSRDFADANWPWPYAAEVRYEIENASLACDLALRNLGGSPMPAGLGFHPFFSRSLREGDDVRVKVMTRGRYPVRGMIPSGPARPDDVTVRLSTGGPMGELALDDVFGGFEPPAVMTWNRSGVEAQVECTANLGHVVVFSPRAEAGMRPWFCVEPVTMVTDGFNLMRQGQSGTGVQVVAPGDWLRCRMSIELKS
jgi:aldose 1-epimerase